MGTHYDVCVDVCVTMIIHMKRHGGQQNTIYPIHAVKS